MQKNKVKIVEEKGGSVLLEIKGKQYRSNAMLFRRWSKSSLKSLKSSKGTVLLLIGAKTIETLYAAPEENVGIHWHLPPSMRNAPTDGSDWLTKRSQLLNNRNSVRVVKDMRGARV